MPSDIELDQRIHYRLLAAVRDERKSREMKQAEIVEKLGEPPTWLSRIENARRLDIVNLIRLGAVIGFDPGKLVSKIYSEVADEILAGNKPKRRSRKAA